MKAALSLCACLVLSLTATAQPFQVLFECQTPGPFPTLPAVDREARERPVADALGVDSEQARQPRGGLHGPFAHPLPAVRRTVRDSAPPRLDSLICLRHQGAAR